ncbi:unnamed protein product [Pleuronectes platessa]|uniref:Uncharacterized protein n=1 Tax=Pleuronectes platessa TaxID=8262 RepID=A0A9N7TUY3_PLEPL|nr:unnamed protein product [Pleuronectes platessa]
MEELLLPRGEEEAGSANGSCAAGSPEGTMGDQMKTFLRATGKSDLRQRIQKFCRRNGLLTLSVIAVLTGCTLGFMLRGTQLSTQQRKHGIILKERKGDNAVPQFIAFSFSLLDLEPSPQDQGVVVRKLMIQWLDFVNAASESES